MSGDKDLLAQLMADALGSEPAGGGAADQPEPVTGVEGGSPQEDRMPWPDSFLGGYIPSDYLACRRMWSAVMVHAINDAKKEQKKALKIKRDTGEMPRALWDVHLLTRPSADLRDLCEAAEIEMDDVIDWARKEFENVLS